MNLSDRLPTNNNIVLSILLFYATFVGMERRDVSERATAFLKSSGYALTDIQEVFRRCSEGRYKIVAGPVSRVRVRFIWAGFEGDDGLRVCVVAGWLTAAWMAGE